MSLYLSIYLSIYRSSTFFSFHMIINRLKKDFPYCMYYEHLLFCKFSIMKIIVIFTNSQVDRGSISGRGTPKAKEWYLMPLYLTLSIISYVSRYVYTSMLWLSKREPSSHSRLQSLTLRIYIYIYVCVCILRIYIYVCMYITYIYVCVCGHMCILRIYIYICVCILRIYIYVCEWSYICVCMYMNIYVIICAYI